MSRSIALARRLIPSKRVYDVLRGAQLASLRLRRRPHDREFAFFAAHADDPGLLVDIGANGGQAAVSFSVFNRRAPILSFEANPAMEGSLRFARLLLGARFRYRIQAVGAEPGTLELHVPYLGRLPLTPRASGRREVVEEYLDSLRGAERRRASIRSFVVDVVPLDALDLDPRFVKIDVEGLEADVIRGARATLQRCRPLVMLEVSDGQEQCAALLRELGYRIYGWSPSGVREVAIPATGYANLFALPGD